jgi:hypothetical protein
MRTRRLLAAVAAGTLLFATQVADPTPASADSVITGVIDPATDPTMPVVSISTPNCVSQGATLVHYDVYPYVTTTAGDHIFTVTGTGTLTSLYLFQDTFTPAAAFSTCIAASNQKPATFTESLEAGRQYYLVVFDDTFTQLGTSYTLTIDGPNTPLTLDPAATTEVPTTEPTTEPPTTEPPVTEPPTTEGPPVTSPSNPTTTTVPPSTRPATGARPVTGRPTFTG